MLPPPARAAPPEAAPNLARPGEEDVAAPGAADVAACSLGADAPVPDTFDETFEPLFAMTATVATIATSTSASPAARSRLSETHATGRCSMAATLYTESTITKTSSGQRAMKA
jgi:hypothetical protein